MTEQSSNLISRNRSICSSSISSSFQNEAHSLNHLLQHNKSSKSASPVPNLESSSDIDLDILDLSDDPISPDLQFPPVSRKPSQNSSSQNPGNKRSLNAAHQPNSTSSTQIHSNDQLQITSPRRIHHENQLNLQISDDSSDSDMNPSTNRQSFHRKRLNSPDLTINTNLRSHNNEPPPQQESTSASGNYNIRRSPPQNNSNRASNSIWTIRHPPRPPTPIPSYVARQREQGEQRQQRVSSDDSDSAILISDDDFDFRNSERRSNDKKTAPFSGPLWSDYTISSQDKDEELCCAICMCDFSKGEGAAKLGCGHVFHVDCISPWLNKSGQRPTCPLCRQDLSKPISKKNNNNK